MTRRVTFKSFPPEQRIQLTSSISPFRASFFYSSNEWTSQAPYGKTDLRGELKLPGYWLRNSTKICVTITMGTCMPQTTQLLPCTVSYSALHRGINMTWPADLSNITTQPNINKRCLVKGLNTLGPHPWQIKSRVGLVSQSSSECSLPYLVRGLGISYKDRKPITCGDIIITNQMTFETYPGFCRIYIQ